MEGKILRDEGETLLNVVEEDVSRGDPWPPSSSGDSAAAAEGDPR